MQLLFDISYCSFDRSHCFRFELIDRSYCCVLGKQKDRSNSLSQFLPYQELIANGKNYLHGFD